MLVDGLVALLAADAGVKAVIGDRDDNTSGIFAGQVPEGTQPPVIAYGYAYEEGDETLDGPGTFTRARVEFWHQGTSYREAKLLARAARKAFENFTGTLADGSEVDNIHRISELDTYQDAPILYLTSVEYEVAYRDVGS